MTEDVEPAHNSLYIGGRPSATFDRDFGEPLACEEGCPNRNTLQKSLCHQVSRLKMSSVNNIWGQLCVSSTDHKQQQTWPQLPWRLPEPIPRNDPSTDVAL